MPKLEEVRRWLEGKHVDGLPDKWIEQQKKPPVKTSDVLERELDRQQRSGVASIVESDDFGLVLCPECGGDYIGLSTPCFECGFLYPENGITSVASGSAMDPSIAPVAKHKKKKGTSLEKALDKLRISIPKPPTRRAKYTISADGRDAMLRFGKHKGETLSSIAITNPSYLVWMLEQDFEADLQTLIRTQMRENGLGGIVVTAEKKSKKKKKKEKLEFEKVISGFKDIEVPSVHWEIVHEEDDVPF